MAENEGEDIERLKRHLRAASAVNRQLRAQLEAGTIHGVGTSGAPAGDDLLAGADADGRQRALVMRRVSTASAWLEQLRLQSGAGASFLVRAPNGHAFLVEGTLRRRIKAGLLMAALRPELGPPRDVSDVELEGWSEGPPVEVLEGGSGPAFIIVGGRRLPIRGLPLPYPVSTYEMVQFPMGDELDIASSPQSRPVAQARELLARQGVARGGAMVLRKAANRLRKLRPRSQ